MPEDRPPAPPNALALPRTHAPTRARYSDDEKARALVLCCLHAPDYHAASAACYADGLGSIPAPTLRNWHQRARGISPAVVQLAQPYARATAEAFETVAAEALAVAGRTLAHVTRALDRADAAGVAIPVDVALVMAERAARIAGLMTDKAQLLIERPTETGETRALSLLALLTPPGTGSDPCAAP